MKVFSLLTGLAAALSCDNLSSEIDQAKCLVKQVAELSTQFQNPEVRDKEACIKYFLEGCFYCAENIQVGHPFCQEDNPNFNGIACALVMNKCLIEQLDGTLKLCHA